MLLVLAVLSLAIGNLTAIAQTNLKRMLAYSTIAQIGFVLLGMMAGVAGTDSRTPAAAAYSAAMYYSITYVLTTWAASAIMMLARVPASKPRNRRLQGPGQAQPVVRGRHDDPDVLAGRRAADDGLHGQVGGAAGRAGTGQSGWRSSR
jgi:NADH:ubiquinone oxidoreductase subunit 2 (subunit N)